MSHKTFVWICLLPLAVVTAAFFLLPMARLVVTGAEGPHGLAGYLAIVVEPRYRATLINTVLLAAATTIVTLMIATVAGMFTIIAVLLTCWVGQDLQYAPGFSRPMTYYFLVACGIVFVTLLSGLYLRRGAPEIQ